MYINVKICPIITNDSTEFVLIQVKRINDSMCKQKVNLLM